nr:hypothetical protein CFP56_67719 [Quercus suber]
MQGKKQTYMFFHPQAISDVQVHGFKTWRSFVRSADNAQVSFSSTELATLLVKSGYRFYRPIAPGPGPRTDRLVHIAAHLWCRCRLTDRNQEFTDSGHDEDRSPTPRRRIHDGLTCKQTSQHQPSMHVASPSYQQ